MDINTENNQTIDASGVNKKKVYITVAIVGFAVVAIAVISFYLYQQSIMQEEQAPYSREESRAYQLREGDEEYKNLYIEGRSARRDLRDYELAVEKYEAALSLAEHSDEIGQIKFELALAKTEQQRYLEAVRLLKEVAVDASVSNLLRAAAVERMGKMYYDKINTTILDGIFLQGDEPFRNFLVRGDIDASIKNLFEYGSSLYPTAYMELRTALWYAEELVNQATGQPSSVDLTEEDIEQVIRTKIENADRDIEAIRNEYASDARIATALLRKAEVAAELEKAGRSFLGDPEDIYREAMREARITGSRNGEAWAAYNLARFLSHNRMPEKRADIVTLLQSLYTAEGVYDNTGVFFMFAQRKESDAQASIMRRDTELLAEIDPDFKAFLEERFGWEF